MYVWDETTASRELQEIASYCLRHLQNVTTQSHVIEYSDILWKITSQQVIDHKFLLFGNSYLPNDADFDIIEMALRKKNFLYISQDYYDVTGRCRKNNKFILHEMKRENFISEKNLQNAIQKCMRKNTNGEKLYWLKICWMRFCKSALYTILYKISMEDIKFKTLDLSPIYQERSLKFKRIALAPLYNDARSITHEKYKDMEQLLSYTPLVHQEYFKKLPHKEYK
ncbi:hypothetical protein HZH68_016153 [Vespula germanica]|uniref:Uncharacterized protein n=1 Tax=Vespula germanica TaxID=30212 RepID=A0A834J453_VESGE|nr:hypothetical protein HZH68_016153 [Vespula germanica]